jgi:hypothetical protein
MKGEQHMRTKAHDTLDKVRALRRLTRDNGVNTVAAQGGLLRRLGQQDLTEVATELAEWSQQ